jgi:ActR/RegA family two-component response regulator
LHDIGMGVQGGEKDRAEAARVGISRNEVIRRHHHERSDQFVRDHAGELYLDDGQASMLGLLCKVHCSSEVLGKPPYVNRAGHFGRPVRVPLLAAILRIADELDLDHTRAPSSVRVLLDNTGWFDSISRLHWLKHYYTLSTTIEATVGAEITITPRIIIRVPRSADSAYYFERIKSLLFSHLEREISSVRSAGAAGFYCGDPKFEVSVQEKLAQRLLKRDHIRLLIVDDDPGYLELVVGALKARFGDVTPVSNPLEAFALVTRNPERFHAGIIDLDMPGLPGEDDGMDAGVALLSAFSGVAADMALVANTGHVDGAWRAKALEAGAHVVRTKLPHGVDTEAEDLRATVEKALDLLGYDIERENDDDQGKKISDSHS